MKLYNGRNSIKLDVRNTATIHIPADAVRIISTSSKGDQSKWRVGHKWVKRNTRGYEGHESLDMQAYNRWGIVRKTHGVMADDEIWLRFKGEELPHKDVCLRKDLYYPDSSDDAIQSNI